MFLIKVHLQVERRPQDPESLHLEVDADRRLVVGVEGVPAEPGRK